MKFNDVFVVDDDKIFHFLIKKLLSSNNIDVSPNFFENGLQAIEGIKSKLNNGQNPPDLILLDINMPVMDGWEFMEELGLIKPKFMKQIVVYIVSSSIALEDKNKSKSYENILGYLSKPVTVDDLISIASTV